MRAYPNIHPLVARHLGIRIMYSPPACPQHDLVDPSAGSPLHAQFRWSHAVLFEPTHETETTLNLHR